MVLAAATFRPLPAQGQNEKNSGKWEKLEGCRLIAAPGNDGDSFHVSHRGKNYLFRLCYVDTPEGEYFSEMKNRLRDQQEYFQISREELFRLAEEAKRFSAAKLAGGFTVWTDWQDAQGASSIPRFFGVIETRTGDLAELLVSFGLARVYGYMPRHPKGQSGSVYMDKLRTLEKAAFGKRTGAWRYSTRKAPPTGP